MTATRDLRLMVHTKVFLSVLLYLVSDTQPTSGLTQPLTLCETLSPITVRDLSGGTIQHVQRSTEESTDECQMVLTGFNSSAYISLPGLAERGTAGQCRMTNTEIIIDERVYCTNESRNETVIKLNNGTVTLQINQTVESFKLNYYSNVAICDSVDTIITIPRNSASDQLFGVIAYQGGGMCATNISNPQEREMRLELLYSTSGDGEDVTFNEFAITKSRPRYFRANSTLVTLQPTALFQNALLKWTVLTCGDAPEVQKATSNPSPNPQYLGSQVNFTCSEKGYEFKRESSVTCQLDSNNQSLEWSDTSEITCIPVPRCLKALKNLSNAERNQSRDNLTATYQCIPGYQAPSGQREITFTCSSSDPDTVPWTWNDTDIQHTCTIRATETGDSDVKIRVIVGSVIGGAIALSIAIVIVYQIVTKCQRPRCPMRIANMI